MSIASELNNYRSGLEDAYDAVSDMSGTIPTDRNMNNLDDAIRTIPISSPNDGVLTITQNGTTVQTFSANQATNVTAALTDTTYSDFTGATSSAAGAAGLVPAPAAGDEGKALHGDGTWKDTTAKLVEMAYGESNAWAKFIAAYNAGSTVYCRASSNSNPASGSQTRKAFMAYVNNATNPTSVEFQYVRSVSSKTDSQQCDQVFVYTLTNASGGTWSVASRSMAPKINVSGAITKTFSNGANATVTIGASAMTGATSSAAGAAGVVPAPAAGDQNDVLKGDGTWGLIDSSNFSGYLTANTTDTWVPVSTDTGELQHRVIKPFNADGTIPTSAIADGAVTDVKLATPHWKVVSVVNGTNAWNIPAGYRYYRVRMACAAGTPSSGTPAAYVSCDGKTDTAWSSGIYNEWSSTSGFQASWDTTTNIVMYASTTAISGAGLTLSSQIELTRTTSGGNYFEGYCITSGSGADWTVQGKLEFSASGSFNLYYERSGCTLSNFHGYVEALVE